VDPFHEGRSSYHLAGGIACGAGRHRLHRPRGRSAFAERGYEHVAVSDVAREAEVAEQTVYNYFRTKEQLVTDRERS
jgi:hypothetical protein